MWRKMVGVSGGMEGGNGVIGDGVFDVQQVVDVKVWLWGVFEVVGKEVLEFEYMLCIVVYFYNFVVFF